MVDNEERIVCPPHIEFDHINPDGDRFLKRLDRILLGKVRGTSMTNDQCLGDMIPPLVMVIDLSGAIFFEEHNQLLVSD